MFDLSVGRCHFTRCFLLLTEPRRLAGTFIVLTIVQTGPLPYNLDGQLAPFGAVLLCLDPDQLPKVRQIFIPSRW